MLYKAFISYTKKDDKQASKLYESIERFKLNGKKIFKGKVFKDTQKQAATAHLTEDILEALDNSEYLVSPEKP